MKVIVDDKIPYIREAIEEIAGEVVYCSGDKFTRSIIKGADALIIRTRTKCDRNLLEGSNVKFIATATIGYDHIDASYCQKAGIAWTNAQGSNSSSVRQYMESSFILLEQQKGVRLKGKTLGIVGVGNVGSKVETLAHGMGMNILLNDPPRQDREGDAKFCSLKQIARECDIITFHTPLSRVGKHPSFHLAGESFFCSLQQAPILINTSRGEVIDTPSLLAAMSKGLVSEVVVDVWENEPDIDRQLLEKAFIATPHIAGYSADGKANASRMALEAFCHFFRIEKRPEITPPPPAENIIHARTTEEALLKIYNPAEETVKLKSEPERFEQFRNNYPLRREKEAYRIVGVHESM